MYYLLQRILEGGYQVEYTVQLLNVRVYLSLIARSFRLMTDSVRFSSLSSSTVISLPRLTGPKSITETQQRLNPHDCVPHHLTLHRSRFIFSKAVINAAFGQRKLTCIYIITCLRGDLVWWSNQQQQLPHSHFVRALFDEITSCPN